MTKKQINEAFRAAGLRTDLVGSAPKWFMVDTHTLPRAERAAYGETLTAAGIAWRALEGGRLMVDRPTAGRA